MTKVQSLKFKTYKMEFTEKFPSNLYLPCHLFSQTEVAIMPVSDLDTSRSSLCMHNRKYSHRWNTRQLLKWTQLFYMWWYRRITCINMPHFPIFYWWAWYSFLFYNKCYREHWVYATFHLCVRVFSSIKLQLNCCVIGHCQITLVLSTYVCFYW